MKFIARDQINLKFDKIIKHLKHGMDFIYIITNQNEIYVFGDNTWGQLGSRNKNLNKQQFTKINLENLENNEIKLLECGMTSAFIVTKDNKIYGTGKAGYFLNSNKFIEMKSDSFLKENISFLRVFSDALYIITKNNLIYIYYKNCKGDCLKLNLLIKDLQCGCNHYILLDKFGDIYGKGKNQYGQLGLQKKNYDDFTKINLPFKIKRIFCSFNESFVLNEVNELYGTGFNYHGQLGISANNKKVMTFTKIILNNNNEIIENIYPSFTDYNLVKTVDNKIYVTGKNDFNVFELNGYVKYLDKFTLFNFAGNIGGNVNKESENYCYPLLFYDKIILVYGDYKILGDNEEDNLLGLSCFMKLKNCNLIDVTFDL